MIADLEGEIWKDIPEYEGSYQVSNMGRFKSLGRMAETKSPHTSLYKINEKILKPDTIRGGYLRFTVSLKGKTKRFTAHVLVAKLFIPNPENKPFVNHKKGIKTDNRASELEWCTSSENEIHSHKILGKVPPEAKLVLDFDTGIFYNSISQAAIARNIKPESLLRSIYRGINKTNIKIV